MDEAGCDVDMVAMLVDMVGGEVTVCKKRHEHSKISSPDGHEPKTKAVFSF